MKMQLSLETLKDFDMGKASVAWQKALGQVVRDCLDRPGDKKVRSVVMTTSIKPIVQQDGDVIDCEVEFTVDRKVPAWQTASRPAIPTKKGQLFFNDMAPDNPRQATIDEVQD